MTTGDLEFDFEKSGVATPNGTLFVQGPTPPQSPQAVMLPDLPTSDATDGSTLISVSTSFSPQFRHNDILPSLILLSSDSVHFYVHAHVLTAMSTNEFDGLLSNQFRQMPSADVMDALSNHTVPIQPIPVHSATLNVLLHAVYNISCASFAPSTNTLIEAVDLLPSYGVAPVSCVYSHPNPQARLSLSNPTPPSLKSPNPSPLYSLLLSHAPLHPVSVYILAAHHSIEDLAIMSSQYLLSTPLHAISDHAAARMGAVYLKKLTFLLLGRVEALKRLLAQPPPLHAPTTVCGPFDQKKLARAWTLAVASLVWEATPDMPTSLIETSLKPLGIHLECHLCQYNLRDRVRDVTMQWLNVKVGWSSFRRLTAE
ncbi:hypothetical protein ONZ45_g5198 [Pleurotus djamor]|nr:hypothetical protein ONZ45_g5198 [Pleurotus djamor]